MKVIDEILLKVEELPTLPTVYAALSDVIDNPRSTAADLANVISRDQSAAAKVLKAANSSIYGLYGRVTNISQAVLYIGFEEIKNLIIALSIINLFSDTKKTGSFSAVDLWKHSIAVGAITRLLGKTIGVKRLDDYFISGILHDIGKLLFYRFLGDRYSKVLDYAFENNVPARTAEKDVLGVTHTVVGDLLAEKWRLPKSIRNSISYHYSGFVEGKFDYCVACVHIADVVACMLELGQAGDNVVPQPNPDLWQHLDLPENVFTALLPNILRDYMESVNLILKN